MRTSAVTTLERARSMRHGDDDLRKQQGFRLFLQKVSHSERRGSCFGDEGADSMKPLVRLSRSEAAGVATAKALAEMIHLRYQNDTAARFWRGLMRELRRNQRMPNMPVSGGTPSAQVAGSAWCGICSGTGEHPAPTPEQPYRMARCKCRKPNDQAERRVPASAPAHGSTLNSQVTQPRKNQQ